MHPHEGHDDDDEEQHEAARPQAGLVQQHAEQDRQDEAAKAADHADETADSADIAGIIDRDMLEDGCLAQGHEEAEDEDRYRETDYAHFGVEGQRAIIALDDIIRWRIRQNEGRHQRDGEGPVHDPARAVDI